MKKIVYLLFAAFTIIMLFCSCHREQDEIEISKIIEIHESAINILNDLDGVPGQSIETILNNCVQQLLLNPEVAFAQVLDSNQILIRHKSGITSVVFLDEETVGQDKSSSKPTDIINKGLNDEVLITNHKVLIWNAWGSASETTTLQNIFSNCSDIDFEVDVKQGNECTIQSLSNLTKYGFVYISTHGDVLTNSQGEELTWLLTNEICSPSDYSVKEVKGERIVVITKVEVTKEYVGNQEVIRFPQEGKHYWGISNKYISQHVAGTFSGPSVVFVSACKSFTSSSLRNAFIEDKNASFYVGFNYKVSFAFAKKKAVEFATNMLQKRLNALDAYSTIEVKVDPIKRGMLICSRKEIPTYFEKDGYLKCDDGRTYQLHSCHYSPGGNLTFLHSNADGEPSFVMAFFSLTMCNTALGNLHPLQPSTTDEWMNLNSTDPLGFWVKSPCTDVSSRLSIAGGGSIKMTDGAVTYNSSAGFSFWFIDEDGHRWDGTYNGPVS